MSNWLTNVIHMKTKFSPFESKQLHLIYWYPDIVIVQYCHGSVSCCCCCFFFLLPLPTCSHKFLTFIAQVTTFEVVSKCIGTSHSLDKALSPAICGPVQGIDFGQVAFQCLPGLELYGGCNCHSRGSSSQLYVMSRFACCLMDEI